MNDRIKEIAEQATQIVMTQAMVMTTVDWQQTFAELIVHECFSKLTMYMDDQFIDDIESELKEHFGVK